MSKGIGKYQAAETVGVKCLDNGRTVTATVVRRTKEFVLVELAGGVRLQLMRQEGSSGVGYVGRQGGLEFVLVKDT